MKLYTEKGGFIMKCVAEKRKVVLVDDHHYMSSCLCACLGEGKQISHLYPLGKLNRSGREVALSLIFDN